MESKSAPVEHNFPLSSCAPTPRLTGFNRMLRIWGETEKNTSDDPWGFTMSSKQVLLASLMKDAIVAVQASIS